MTGTGSHTRLIGLIGWPVRHSLSPGMHNAAFAALKLDFAYLPLPVDPSSEQHLQQALVELRTFGFAGANITIPYKERVIPYLDRLSPSAAAIGAVNVISVGTSAEVGVDYRSSCHSTGQPRSNDPGFIGEFADGGGQDNDTSLFAMGSEETGRDCLLLGDNTDALGFIGDLDDRKVQVKDTSALLLGSGGAARAVAYALAERGARRLILSGRTISGVERVVEQLAVRFGSTAFEARPIDDAVVLDLEQVDLVVNCTPVGLTGHEEAPWLDVIRFSPGQIAYDLVYGSKRTLFLQRALECGAVAISGLGMLVRQAAASFEIWTGVKAPIDIMREVAFCGSDRMEK